MRTVCCVPLLQNEPDLSLSLYLCLSVSVSPYLFFIQRSILFYLFFCTNTVFQKINKITTKIRIITAAYCLLNYSFLLIYVWSSIFAIILFSFSSYCCCYVWFFRVCGKKRKKWKNNSIEKRCMRFIAFL